MAQTSFTGPVNSQNGFTSGTSASPVTVTTAQNINSSYGSTSATSGDTRLVYEKLTFTSTGSGETFRAYSVVTGASAATAGTINGAHISCDVNTGGSISGAANALRATLGGTATTPGGTVAVVQLDTNYNDANVALPATSSFIRVSDSGSATGEVQNLVRIETGPAATIAPTAGNVATLTRAVKIMVGSTALYIPAYASYSA